MILEKERQSIVEYGKKLAGAGLVVGTFGNISIYDVVVLSLDGTVVDGKRKPSSELDMHRIFYQNRTDVKAVVHTHSHYATVLACLNWSIPPLHYETAYAGKEVPCSEYVQFGTWELAESALKTMGEGNACLLGNHGMLSAGETISYAFDAAQQIEFVAGLYCGAKALGSPVLLTDEQIGAVLHAFKTYRTK